MIVFRVDSRMIGCAESKESTMGRVHTNVCTFMEQINRAHSFLTRPECTACYYHRSNHLMVAKQQQQLLSERSPTIVTPCLTAASICQTVVLRLRIGRKQPTARSMVWCTTYCRASGLTAFQWTFDRLPSSTTSKTTTNESSAASSSPSSFSLFHTAQEVALGEYSGRPLSFTFLVEMEFKTIILMLKACLLGNPIRPYL